MAYRYVGSARVSYFYVELGFWLVKSVFIVDLLLSIIVFWSVRSSD